MTNWMSAPAYQSRRLLIPPASAAPDSGEDRDGQRPAAVEEQQEDQLGAEALDEPGLEREERSPGVPDERERRDRGGDELGVDGGARLADDEGSEHAGEQPWPVEETLQAGQQGLEDRTRTAVRDVPQQEDQARCDADHAGDDDVDDPPAKARRNGGRLDGCGCVFRRGNAHDVLLPALALPRSGSTVEAWIASSQPGSPDSRGCADEYTAAEVVVPLAGELG